MAVTSKSQLVVRDSNLNTVTMLFSFEGDLATFNVFYNEVPESSNSVKLTTLIQGSSMPKTPFCFYRLLNSNLLELTFPKNIYFTPALNSEIRVDIYTSLGENGNFKKYDGMLSFTPRSEKYPYNNNMTFIGMINGSCTGGKPKPTIDEYREQILDAYSTNNTITTSNDLQIYFDKLSAGSKNKIKFIKKRSDAFTRLYGAYCLLKDEYSNVVPTNDLTLEIHKSDFDSYSEAIGRGFIKPGCLFEYKPDTTEINYRGQRATDITIDDNLDIYDDNSRFVFTNPFLIAITMNPNLIGFYLNGIDEVKPIEYSYINDNTITQFIGSNLRIYRNPIAKENYYTFSITISPTTEIDPSTVIQNPTTDENNVIRAKKNGKVISRTFKDNHVVATIRYVDGTTEEIDIGSYVEKDENGEYVYHTGYKMNFDVYDSFIAGDVLATKKVTDLGVIRFALDFNQRLITNNMYVPMVIEEYNPELNTYTATGYVSTDDILYLDSTMLISRGIFDMSGDENKNVSIPMKNIIINISVFYNDNNINFSHKYSSFDYFKRHSLVNTYSESSDNSVSLIQQIDFIRSTIVFEEDPNDESGFKIILKEVPLTKANWLKDESNFSYLTNAIYENYRNLYNTYFLLENNFGIDLKFYNTYGKSRFFKVGIRDHTSILKHVNCSFKFGIYLKSISTQDIFLERFRTYVKEYVEAINTTTDQAIYIMNMISDIKRDFPEIGYLEYYGFNDYGYDAQKIVPIENDELSDSMKTDYIPEFINIYTSKIDGTYIPKIDVVFLEESE